jgi:hypothetical protein
LQSSKSPDQHYLPNADDREQIDCDAFKLQGWIVDRDRPGGLDDSDPWAGAIKFPPPRPAPFVSELMALDSDAEQRTWTAGGGPAMWVETWGQYQEKDDDDEGHDSGERLRASLGFIIEFLRNMDMDLIVKVDIDRRLRRSRYESNADDIGYVPGSAKYFLIRSDGSLASL